MLATKDYDQTTAQDVVTHCSVCNDPLTQYDWIETCALCGCNTCADCTRLVQFETVCAHCYGE